LEILSSEFVEERSEPFILLTQKGAAGSSGRSRVARLSQIFLSDEWALVADVV